MRVPCSCAPRPAFATKSSCPFCEAPPQTSWPPSRTLEVRLLHAPPLVAFARVILTARWSWAKALQEIHEPLNAEIMLNVDSCLSLQRGSRPWVLEAQRSLVLSLQPPVRGKLHPWCEKAPALRSAHHWRSISLMLTILAHGQQAFKILEL